MLSSYVRIYLNMVGFYCCNYMLLGRGEDSEDRMFSSMTMFAAAAADCEGVCVCNCIPAFDVEVPPE